MIDNWKIIEAFQFEKNPQEYGFEIRLSYENGWTDFFTEKAILEYKKFMFLVSISEEMLAPSEIVDIVWHQHLIYSDSYAKLCEILGKKVKHIPSNHDSEEVENFINAFKNTEKLYKQNFDSKDWAFWEIKTDLDLLDFNFQKNRKLENITLFLLITIVFTALLFYLLRPVLINIDSSYFLLGYVVFFIAIYVFIDFYSLFYFRKNIQNKGGKLVDKLSPNEIIYIQNQSLNPIIDISLFSMIKEKQLLISGKKLSIIHKRISETVEEKAIRNCFVNFNYLGYNALVSRLSIKNCFLRFEKSTQKITEFIKSSKEYLRFQLVCIFIFAIILSLGFCRLILGFTRDKPIVMISIVCIIGVLAVIHLIKYRMNSNFHLAFKKEIIRKQYFNAEVSNNLNLSYLLLGTPVFGTEFNDLITNSKISLSQQSSAVLSANYSCSSGDSLAANCGSSCGGCGGGD